VISQIASRKTFFVGKIERAMRGLDYLQLLMGETSGQNRVEEVSKISRQLKLLSRELGCPILALSQLSRAVEQRAGEQSIAAIRPARQWEPGAGCRHRALHLPGRSGACGRFERGAPRCQTVEWAARCGTGV